MFRFQRTNDMEFRTSEGRHVALQHILRLNLFGLVLLLGAGLSNNAMASCAVPSGTEFDEFGRELGVLIKDFEEERCERLNRGCDRKPSLAIQFSKPFQVVGASKNIPSELVQAKLEQIRKRRCPNPAEFDRNLKRSLRASASIRMVAVAGNREKAKDAIQSVLEFGSGKVSEENINVLKALQINYLLFVDVVLVLNINWQRNFKYGRLEYFPHTYRLTADLVRVESLETVPLDDYDIDVDADVDEDRLFEVIEARLRALGPLKRLYNTNDRWTGDMKQNVELRVTIRTFETPICLTASSFYMDDFGMDFGRLISHWGGVELHFGCVPPHSKGTANVKILSTSKKGYSLNVDKDGMEALVKGELSFCIGRHSRCGPLFMDNINPRDYWP